MSNDFVLINQAQIDDMAVIMDYILTHPGDTVGHIKRKFNLNEDQYQMIFEFCMPHVRNRTNERYWIYKYKSVYSALQELYGKIKNDNRKTVPIDKIEDILQKNSIGANNEGSQDAFDTCGIDDEDKEEEDDE